MSKIEVIEDFRYRLDKALSLREMKPIDLARRTGISESTISQYRSGYAKPKEKKLMIIAKSLNVNPTWLLGLDVPMEVQLSDRYSNESAQVLIKIKNSPKLLELCQDFLRLPEVQQDTICSLVKSMLPDSPRMSP